MDLPSNPSHLPGHPQPRFPVASQSSPRCVMTPSGHIVPACPPGQQPQQYRFYPAGPSQKPTSSTSSSNAILVHGQIIRFDATGAMDLRMGRPHPGHLGPIIIPPKSFSRESFVRRFPGLPPPPPGYAACFFQPQPGARFTMPPPRFPASLLIRPTEDLSSQSQTESIPRPVMTATVSPNPSELSPPVTPPSPPHLPITPTPTHTSTPTSSTSTPLQHYHKDGIQMLIDCLTPLTEPVASTCSDDSACSADSGNATGSLEMITQTSPGETFSSTTSQFALPTSTSASAQDGEATPVAPGKGRGRGRKRRAPSANGDSAVGPAVKQTKRSSKASLVKWPESREEDPRYKVLGLKCLVPSCKIIVENDVQLAHHLNDHHEGAGLFQCAVTGCGINFKTR